METEQEPEASDRNYNLIISLFDGRVVLAAATNLRFHSDVSTGEITYCTEEHGVMTASMTH